MLTLAIAVSSISAVLLVAAVVVFLLREHRFAESSHDAATALNRALADADEVAAAMHTKLRVIDQAVTAAAPGGRLGRRSRA